MKESQTNSKIEMIDIECKDREERLKRFFRMQMRNPISSFINGNIGHKKTKANNHHSEPKESRRRDNGLNNIEGYRHQVECHFHQIQAIPPLPPIKCDNKSKRLEPLSVPEYERKYREQASDLELVERVFLGGMASNQLRAALWPYLFGLVEHRGCFKPIVSDNGVTIDFVYEEHEKNLERWQELERLYLTFQSQWKSIQPDQELRFSVFRERKSLIERDVIRSDRSHPFYADNSQNLNSFTNLLMTYMMYDFDIGYLQGMSDIAAPILYMFNGNIVKSFWVFVEVMKLFRRNFEFSQETIHFQLGCLFRLIQITDPKFAKYLSENDCSNCFFTFRCIVCKFKRELMKPNKNTDGIEQDYTNVLSLWDTIWSVQRRHELLSKSNYVHTFTIANGSSRAVTHSKRKKQFSSHFSNHNNSCDQPLTETEKFVISLCLSLIRRERNYIMQHQLDSSEIHQHFIDPELSGDINNFIENAYHIYNFLNSDCDMRLVVKDANELDDLNIIDVSPKAGTADTYDLLQDYLIISPTSYNLVSRHAV